ncbi:class I SAM-dependent methyltransferase [Candidatus Babeliales bacterium]|nr:class I SAM-dependent methyltransferase [Candidatus Babeliales bacterium]
METMAEIFKRYSNRTIKYGTDKGSIHSYVEVYEKMFAPYRNDPGNMLEIGVAGGFSLKLWRDYFPTKHIYGIDKNQRQGVNSEERITICLQDSTKGIPSTMENMKFDIIIDDGDHKPQSQVATFNHYFPLLKEGGVYIIEDTRIDLIKQVTDNIPHPCEVMDRSEIKGCKIDCLIVVRKPSGG